jgi:ABC-type uncharacterized transport system auxiliary subunit
MKSAPALLIAAVAAGVLLGACTISRPVLERQSFVLDATRTGPPANVRKPVALKVGLISVAPPYSGRAFTYRTGELRYEADPYAGFFAAPRDLIAREVAEWLEQAGLFMAVREPASPVGAPFVLDGLVTELYGDARDAQHTSAVVTIRFHLHTENDRSNPLFERVYTQHVGVDGGEPAALVRGYGTALARILAELEQDLAAVALR